MTLLGQFFKNTGGFDLWIKCARDVLKLPKRKSRLGLVKACLLEGMFSGEVLREGCEKGQHPVSQELWPVKILEISEIGQKATPLTWLPEASLSDFHWYDFYIKSMNIRMICAFPIG